MKNGMIMMIQHCLTTTCIPGVQVDYVDRENVENLQDNSFLHTAKEMDVAFLVVGDPLCATTHHDLILRAREMGVKVDVIHNASVMGAVASCGLQLYNFGATISLCLWNEDMSWRPSSWYDKFRYNKLGGMHTLCLLDIKVREPDFLLMAQGRGTHYLPPKFMTIADAVQQLLEVENQRKEGLCGPNTIAVGLARLGQKTQKIVAGTLKHLSEIDMGPPLHSLIVPGDMHVLEKDFLQAFAIDPLGF